MNAFKAAAIGAFCAVAATAGSATAAAPVPNKLTGQILSTIANVPANSEATLYEAQITAVLDHAGQPCPFVRRAIADARGQTSNVAAKAALANLTNVFSDCGQGTAALGRGGATSIAGAPGFAVGGGGSNYRQ